jgi:hypothetical protein
MEFLALLIAAVALIGGLGWVMAHYLPRFSGYLLGGPVSSPALMLR